MSSTVPTIEEIVLDKGETGLGFNIRGGTDNIHVANDPGIFVTTIKMNGAAAKDGRLHTGDKILELNGNDLREVPHQKAVSHFHSAGTVVSLLVERGAEQRILSQASDNDSLIHNFEMQKLRPPYRSHRRQRDLWWGWVPVTLLVGGSAALLLFWYIRRRRQ